MACATLQRVIIYPNYLNSTKTVAEGRRIPKDKGKGFVDIQLSILQCSMGFPCSLQQPTAYGNAGLMHQGSDASCCAGGKCHIAAQPNM